MKVFDGEYKSPPKQLIDTEIKNIKDNYIYYYNLFLSISPLIVSFKISPFIKVLF